MCLPLLSFLSCGVSSALLSLLLAHSLALLVFICSPAPHCLISPALVLPALYLSPSQSAPFLFPCPPTSSWFPAEFSLYLSLVFVICPACSWMFLNVCSPAARQSTTLLNLSVASLSAFRSRCLTVVENQWITQYFSILISSFPKHSVIWIWLWLEVDLSSPGDVFVLESCHATEINRSYIKPNEGCWAEWNTRCTV